MSDIIKDQTRIAKPFLRWAGGKRWLLKDLKKIIPSFNNYYEPFLGGASVFLFLKQNELISGDIYLSDSNAGLIQCYEQVRDNIERVVKSLSKYRNERDFYYSIRSSKFRDSTDQAARFIYLNRTSFNGIYRVNSKGEYNVPYGFKSYKTLFDFENLRLVSENLKGVSLSMGDFESGLESIQKGDLAFLDPPYTVAHKNNGFLKYNQKIFSWDDQVRLASVVEKIVTRGAYYILTNAAHRSVGNLFKMYGKKMIMKRYSVIGGKMAKRGKINEYFFTNIGTPD